MIGVIVFTSFFVRFLVFELSSIMYFTVVNSDLGLRRLVGKQRSLALQNMPLTLTCFDYGFKPKASGAWSLSPRWGVRGGRPPAQKNILQKNRSYLNNQGST